MTSRFLAAMAVAVLTSVGATPLLAQSVPGAPAPAPKAAPPKAPAKAPAAKAPAPAQQQAQPAAPAPQQQAGAEPQIQLIYSPWTKFCMKGQETGAKEVCFIGKDGRIESGQPVLAAVIIQPEGEPNRILRITLPLGVQLTSGTQIFVDSGQPQEKPYIICFANGCMADYDATNELIDSFKKGQTLFVRAIGANNSLVQLQLPLAGEFQKAYDGPATDPKVFEEQNQKMQVELQKKAEEARKRLEGAGGAPGTPSPAAK